MGYINFKGLTKKATMKPDGDVEIIIVASGEAMRGQFERLNETLGIDVKIDIEPEVVRYSIEVHPKTEEPIKSYKVDQNGIVSEVKEEGEQLELELEGATKGKISFKNELRELDKEVVDDFIESGLAPAYGDVPIYFPSYIARLRQGETYTSFAHELGYSPGKVAEMFETYRKRVAHLAEPWDEWRKGLRPTTLAEGDAVEKDSVEQPQQVIEEGPTGDTQNADPAQQASSVVENENGAESPEISNAEIEAYITEHHPAVGNDLVDGIKVNWLHLLGRRQGGATWLELGKEYGIPRNKLSAAWNEYKAAVKKLMTDCAE